MLQSSSRSTICIKQVVKHRSKSILAYSIKLWQKYWIIHFKNGVLKWTLSSIFVPCFSFFLAMQDHAQNQQKPFSYIIHVCWQLRHNIICTIEDLLTIVMPYFFGPWILLNYITIPLYLPHLYVQIYKIIMQVESS